MEREEKNQHLWDRFIRLGERIGDGDLEPAESRWMNREYKILAKQLCPDIADHYKEQKRARNKQRDEQIARLIEKIKCDCGGTYKQSRSGSKVLNCIQCKKRVKAVAKKK